MQLSCLDNKWLRSYDDAYVFPSFYNFEPSPRRMMWNTSVCHAMPARLLSRCVFAVPPLAAIVSLLSPSAGTGISKLPFPDNALFRSCDGQRVLLTCCIFWSSIFRMMWHTFARLANPAGSLFRCASRILLQPALAPLALLHTRMRIVLLLSLSNTLFNEQ